MKFNLSSFKKIHEDDHTATLEHPSGHSIKIAKNQLSKKLQKDLAGLPMHMAGGGQVQDPMADGPVATQMPAIMDDNNPGMFQAAAELTPADPAKLFDSNYTDGIYDPMKAILRNPDKHTMSDRTWAMKEFNSRKVKEAEAQEKAAAREDEQLMAYNEQARLAGVEELPLAGRSLAAARSRPDLSGGAPAAQSSGAPIQQYAVKAAAPAGSGLGSAMSAGLDQSMSGYNRAIGGYGAGLTAEAAALGEQGKRESQLLNEQQNDWVKMQAVAHQEFSKLRGDTEKLIADIKSNQFDPNRYLKNMSAGQKVTTAIGMLLGGIGTIGNPNRPNAAMDFLGQQIERDIEQQKMTLGKQETLLNANFKQYGNLKDAIDMTRLMTGEIYAAKMKQIAAQSTDPLAKARAQQAYNQFQIQTAIPLLQQVAQRRAMMGMMSGPSQAQMSPDTRIRAMKMNGMISDSEAAKAFEELQDMQNKMKLRDKAVSVFQKVAKLQTVGNRTLNPLQSKSQIDALIAPLAMELAKDAAGKYSENEDREIRKMFTSIMDDAQSEQVKLNNLLGFIETKMNFPLLNSLGIAVPSKSINKAQTPAGYR